MECAEKLQQVLTEYLARVEQVQAQRKPADGLLGMGNAPQHDACHDWLDQQVQALTETTSDAEKGRLVQLLLMAEKQNPAPDFAARMLIAIQRHALPLLDHLPAEQAASLLAWYEWAYPARERLPIQKQIVQKMKKQRGR